MSAVDLGIATAKEALARSGATPDQIEEVIYGNVLQAGLGQNPARQISMGAGVPEGVSSFTVNKVCGSGMKALELGWQAISLERANVILAGGTENMTQSPYPAAEYAQWRSSWKCGSRGQHGRGRPDGRIQ